MKERQERMTYTDTIEMQKEMLGFIKKKINNDPHYLLDEEEDYYFECISKCFLSQWSYDTIMPRIQINGGTLIPLGKNVGEFTMKFLDMKRNTTKLKYKSKIFEIETKYLWQQLYDYCLRLFPKAQAEAIHMSREIEKRRRTSIGYQFDSSKKL